MRYEFNNTFPGNEAIPSSYLLGYSVPTKYGGASIPPRYFTRPVYFWVVALMFNAAWRQKYQLYP